MIEQLGSYKQMLLEQTDDNQLQHKNQLLQSHLANMYEATCKNTNEKKSSKTIYLYEIMKQVKFITQCNVSENSLVHQAA